MGLFDFFKSDEEKVRSKIRKGFDGCVRTAVKSAGTNDSFMLGIMVQAAIADFYKSMKDHPAIWMLCNKLGVDYDTILEEECRRALNKYLK